MPHLLYKPFYLLLLLVFLATSFDASEAKNKRDNANRQAACETASRLETSYLEAWRLIQDNTMFPERLTNWDNWKTKYTGKLKNEKQLAGAINSLLKQVGDEYSYFRNSSETNVHFQESEKHKIVDLKILPDNVACITIRSFTSLHTAEELKEELAQCHNVDSYVIDLRDNSGGFVEQALLCYALLVDEGRFVSIRGRQEGKNYFEQTSLDKDAIIRISSDGTTNEERPQNMTGKVPMAVLVNENTKSAAEMLAGALRDVKRAKLIGGKTFGKGVVQNTWYLEPGCSLKIATAKFFLPAGEWIHGKGIEPDVRTRIVARAGHPIFYTSTNGLKELIAPIGPLP